MKTNGKLASRRSPKPTSSISRSPKGMLESIEIKHFRGFRHLLVPGLAPVTVFTGKNGAGKTTMLEAILALYGRMNPAWVFNLQAHRGFDKLKASVGPNYLGLFHGFEDKGSAEIKGEFGPEGLATVKLERSTIRKPNINVRSSTGTEAALPELVCRAFRGKKLVQESAVSWSYDSQGAARLAVRDGRGTDRNALLLHPTDRAAGTEDVQRFGDAKAAGRKDRIVEAMKLMDSRITDVDFLPTTSGDYFSATIENLPRPLGLLGGGINNLFRYLLAIVTVQGGAVGIDEVENGIHHSLLREVFKALVDCALIEKTQLFLTTHSAEALEAIGQACQGTPKNTLSVVHLEREKDDSLRVNTFCGADAVSSLRLGYELR